MRAAPGPRDAYLSLAVTPRSDRRCYSRTRFTGHRPHTVRTTIAIGLLGLGPGLAFGTSLPPASRAHAQDDRAHFFSSTFDAPATRATGTQDAPGLAASSERNVAIDAYSTAAIGVRGHGNGSADAAARWEDLSAWRPPARPGSSGCPEHSALRHGTVATAATAVAFGAPPARPLASQASAGPISRAQPVAAPLRSQRLRGARIVVAGARPAA